MPFGISWPRKKTAEEDRYWDLFVHAAPVDPNNLPADALREAKGGEVYPIKSEVHTPEIMSSHIKDLAKFFGAEMVGVVRLGDHATEEHPLAVICVMKAAYDPRETPGIGGQAPVLMGAYVTFNLSSAIREYGYHAACSTALDAEQLAAAAGLGTLSPQGRLVTREHGARVYAADAILTDLPLAPDGAEVAWPPMS